MNDLYTQSCVYNVIQQSCSQRLDNVYDFLMHLYKRKFAGVFIVDFTCIGMYMYVTYMKFRQLS